MTRWIALLRGVNVGGRNRLAMADLRRIVAQVGGAQVRTYVQSGNVVFAADTDDRFALAERLVTAIDDGCGLRPAVLLLTGDELVAAMAANPFAAATPEPTTLHLFFLSSTPADPDLALLDEARAPTERYELCDQVLYLWTPDGIGRSKLAAKVERAVGVAVTARNWRTVEKLSELVGEEGPV